VITPPWMLSVLGYLPVEPGPIDIPVVQRSPASPGFTFFSMSYSPSEGGLRNCQCYKAISISPRTRWLTCLKNRQHVQVPIRRPPALSGVADLSVQIHRIVDVIDDHSSSIEISFETTSRIGSILQQQVLLIWKSTSNHVVIRIKCRRAHRIFEARKYGTCE
jgi:hypothetical protein